MRICEVPRGEWFKDNTGVLYIKVDPFLRGVNTYQAIDLLTGKPAYVPALSNEEVTVIKKPGFSSL